MVLLGCGSNGGDSGEGLLDVAVCLQVTAEGHTQGTMARLRGSGIFRFGEEEREALVALYLFDLTEAQDGGLRGRANYQFVWDGGDSFLTSDPVFMEPGLLPDQYTFDIPMTIVHGAGLFAGREGSRPISLDAVITFGPPPEPGGLATAVENFTIGGQLCGE
jgi:hypothetical protein